MDAATLTILCSSLATFGGMVLTYLREGRAHQWAKDEADAARLERIQTAADLKAHTEMNARTVAENTKQGVAVLSNKIDENSAINVAAIEAGEKAYTEANQLTMKIRETGLQLRGASRQSDRDVEPV